MAPGADQAADFEYRHVTGRAPSDEPKRYRAETTPFSLRAGSTLDLRRNWWAGRTLAEAQALVEVPGARLDPVLTTADSQAGLVEPADVPE